MVMRTAPVMRIEIVEASGAAARGVVADFRRAQNAQDPRMLGMALKRAASIVDNAASTEVLKLAIE
jgi:hypothetical protein